MPIPSSDDTHVSDSEPEREARRRIKAQSLSPGNSPPLPQHVLRTPLSSISNTLVGSEPIGRSTLEARLSRLEDEIAEIKDEVHDLSHKKRNRTTKSSPSTPLPKRRRTMLEDTATDETPILRSSLMASTPERMETTLYIAEGIQQSIRESYRHTFLTESSRVGPRPSGMARKLRRRLPEYM
ncbi:hypothetical protein C8R44DRAFT_846424 [Mycena epipterygia]|nr:hypothetical protein C8R44DRAFT_846424 [Mycena epipterygia]